MATVMSTSWTIGNKVFACDDEALEVRLRREQPGQPCTVFTSRQSESLLRRYKVAQVSVRHDRRKYYASTGELNVTAERIILLIFQADTGKDSQRYTLITFPREVVASPERRVAGIIAPAKLTISTADGSARAEFASASSKLDDVFRSLQPSSINELGSEAAEIQKQQLEETAAVQRQREAMQAAKTAEQELERVAAVAQRFESQDARKRRGSGQSLGRRSLRSSQAMALQGRCIAIPMCRCLYEGLFCGWWTVLQGEVVGRKNA